MINKTEKEVMRNWKSKEQMIVSITCVAYNQDHFISETLDGFLMQETTFPFEIIINDDASTDKTADIIKIYEDKFPNIVRPVYQTENKFSQGLNVMVPLFPMAKGRYVAICDGDDYWIDKDKLEIQVEEMERNLDIDMCFHPAHVLTGGRVVGVMSKHSDVNKIFTPQEVILGDGGFCPTESLMFRNSLISSLPDWGSRVILLDYVLQVMGAMNGGALYLNRCMTTHRIGNEGSWTHSVYKIANNSEVRKKTLLSQVELLNLLNDCYDNKFQKLFNKLISDHAFKFVKTIVLDVSLREEIFYLYRDTFSKKKRILWYVLYRNKSLHNVVKWTKSILLKGRKVAIILKSLIKLRKFTKP